MSKMGIPLEGFAEIALEAAGEGAVLLKNEGGMLPIRADEKVSVFGRCQIDYYRSGTGSGGSVRVPYTTNLLGGLREKSQVVNEQLASVYENWVRANPFNDGGGGWAAEPWNQQEMPVDMELVRQARLVSEKAVVVIGRTAGEEKDNEDAAPSLHLTQDEKQMLKLVNTYFEQVAIVLNVANMIDLTFMDQPGYSSHVKALLYVWHGGMEGGNGTTELLLGKMVPSGRMPDTQAFQMKDYPSTSYYGNRESNFYSEDIYVGYRYFNTFHPELIRYEFGFGISYTDFSIETKRAEIGGGTGDRNPVAQEINLTVAVKNTGRSFSGKEVVQIYYEAPQGRLGQPVRQLLSYRKTKLLMPDEVQEIEFCIPVSKMKTFDDSGLSGSCSAYVMEAGSYHIYVGSSSLKNKKVLTYMQEDCQVVEQLQEALAPIKMFQRMRPGAMRPDGTYELEFESVPTGTVSLKERIRHNLPIAIPQTGHQGIMLQDIKTGGAVIEDFVGQLTNEELAMLVRGEGMEHPDVTPGTASAFGGVGEALAEYGIPLACTADGPSGLRMGPELRATQIPIGTLLAASFNDELVERLYTYEGREMNRNGVDLLLGPGMNIHRSPLNGRNFEYFSEDSLLTGQMAAAVARGIAAGGGSAVLKHFAANNQETARTIADSVISQRALREIYLRGFEIAVKDGRVQAVMTAYNPINGHWAASNYDLNTTMLRKEWGFQGIVMTDWWAKMNDVEEGGPASDRNMRDMIRAGNDLYMIVNSYGAEANSAEDDILESLNNGKLTVGELQQRALYICSYLMKSRAMGRQRKTVRAAFAVEPLNREEIEARESCALETFTRDPQILVGEKAGNGKILSAKIPMEMNRDTCIHVKTPGNYNIFVRMMSEDFNTAQIAVELYVNGNRLTTIAARGSEGKWMSQKLFRIRLQVGFYSLLVKEVKPHLVVDSFRFELVESAHKS